MSRLLSPVKWTIRVWKSAHFLYCISNFIIFVSTNSNVFFTQLTYIHYVHLDYHDVAYFLLISPPWSSFITTTQLRNTFFVFVLYSPCSVSVLSSFFFFFLCGEDQIERVRRRFKGQTRVPASRAFTSALTESRVNHREMFHRSRHIMRPSESHIKLFTYSIIASLLLSGTPADKKSATPVPRESLTAQNVSFNYCILWVWNMKTNIAVCLWLRHGHG